MIAVGVGIIILAGILRFNLTDDNIYVKTKNGEVVQYDELIKSIKDFDDCENANFEIIESYPRKCAVPDGETFTDSVTADTNESIVDGLQEDMVYYIKVKAKNAK